MTRSPELVRGASGDAENRRDDGQRRCGMLISSVQVRSCATTAKVSDAAELYDRARPGYPLELPESFACSTAEGAFLGRPHPATLSRRSMVPASDRIIGPGKRHTPTRHWRVV
jgi:hypothetical protein